MTPKRHGPEDLIPTEVVAIDQLRPHPRNYKEHPHDQVEHLAASLHQFGQTKNIVVARDNTILTGHGVVEAAWLIDWTTVEVRRLDLDPNEPDALKLLALDNETARFSMNDDRALTELLREVAEQATAGLVGTGYDDAMLANLVMVTRPAHEIAGLDAAAQWVGMPGYVGDAARPPEIVVRFDSDEDRDRLIEQLGITSLRRHGNTWAMWWPPRDRSDLSSVVFDA